MKIQKKIYIELYKNNPGKIRTMKERFKDSNSNFSRIFKKISNMLMKEMKIMKAKNNNKIYFFKMIYNTKHTKNYWINNMKTTITVISTMPKILLHLAKVKSMKTVSGVRISMNPHSCIEHLNYSTETDFVLSSLKKSMKLNRLVNLNLWY